MNTTTHTPQNSFGDWLLLVAQTYHELATAGQEPTIDELLKVLSDCGFIEGSILPAWFKACGILGDWLATENQTSDALLEEAQAMRVAKRAMAPILEVRLQGQLEHSEQNLPSRCCSECGENMVSQGKRIRPWESTLGQLWLKRRYFRCKRCSLGAFPAQEELGLPNGPYTARLEEVCSLMSTTIPYELAQKNLTELLHLDVGETGLKKITERRAEELMRQDTITAQKLDPFDEKGLSRELERPVGAATEAPDLAYVELDGVFVMERQEKKLSASEEKKIPPKSRGGKGRRYEITGREVKNAILYDGKDCVQESEEKGRLLKKTYVSHLGNWQDFARLVWVELRRLRFDEAGRLVVISDGADWIRSFCEWLPVETLMILDLFHVKKRIWEVARALYPDSPKKTTRWAKTQIARVEAGTASKVIQGLRFVKPPTELAEKEVDALKGYLENNRDRMDYPRYRELGLRVGSGAIESTNYHVTGARLKLQGMRWSEQGAAQMARLRADLFNERWEQRTRQFLCAA